MPNTLHLDTNTAGTDYVVGDIHGYFDTLERMLAMVDFNASTDRLFSVGDLIDRGPASIRALEWLAKPWFYPVRGNHEQLLVDGFTTGNIHHWWKNGGQWAADIPPDMRSTWVRAMASLPLALDIQTPSGLVGIVHADVPDDRSWSEFLADLDAGDHQSTRIAQWSRKRPYAKDAAPVSGIERVYCGHTPVDHVCPVQNVWFIDTGVCKEHGCLSLMAIECPANATVPPDTYDAPFLLAANPAC